MGFFSDSKDRFVETMALPVVNRSFLAPYGQARELRINSTNKTAEILVELKGEPEPLSVHIGRYEFSQNGSDTFVTIHSIKTSREWMTGMAEKFLVGRPIKMPAEFAGMLTRVM